MDDEKRSRTPICVGLAWTIVALSLVAIGFFGGVLAVRSIAVEPEELPVIRAVPPDQLVAPEPTSTAVATESAVWEGPVPELVYLGEFKITHYCPCPLCCGEWADGITYTGTKASEGRTIAVDPDVIPLGSTVVIDGQEYIAEDVGGAIQGSRIDIYKADHQAALDAGVFSAEAYIMREVDA